MFENFTENKSANGTELHVEIGHISGLICNKLFSPEMSFLKWLFRGAILLDSLHHTHTHTLHTIAQRLGFHCCKFKYPTFRKTLYEG